MCEVHYHPDGAAGWVVARTALQKRQAVTSVDFDGGHDA
jgi:hypothetical protein